MYESFFGLRQAPFTIAPDPRYLFLSERHREALAHLLYGLEGGGGFVLLSGEIGAGKTTLCRAFLEQVPAHTHVAYVFNPKLDAVELLQTICGEFGVPVPAGPGHEAPTIKDHIDALNAFLLRVHAEGGHSVLIIDEAQNLSADVLEQLRLLTNLETAERKLLQIILIGQPELRGMVARPELEQLAQRVIARYHLGSLDEADTARYLAHRLSVAGLQGELPFDVRAVQRLHALSGGVPRKINLLADRALLGAYAAGRAKVDALLVERAGREVFDSAAPAAPDSASRRRRSRRRSRSEWAVWGLAVGVAVLLGGSVGWWLGHQGDAPRAAALAGSAPVAAAAPLARASAPVAAVPVAVSPAASIADASPEAFALPDERSAWRQLAAAWNVQLGEADPCADLQRNTRLLCLRANLPWNQVRPLDRPGWLLWRDPQGQERPLLLVGLDERVALLSRDGRLQAVPLERLARDWRGVFATLWRPPDGYSGALTAGRSGPAVDALAQGLARWAGQPLPEPGATLDAALLARLQAFQRAQGLVDDGVAGPATFMLLNRVTGVAEPRLRRPDAAPR
ncbi:ExeA family protein [Ideonella alba]|uniref:AAA family ATPase n=1 Tax=Ideonella alba TaxID=2824118 RepID=A0A941BDD7_9BURK|nr:AAA family ATPase [Ideonella alba]MBQ0930106.1 AAA family ATPase [Ideonella alba]